MTQGHLRDAKEWLLEHLSEYRSSTSRFGGAFLAPLFFVYLRKLFVLHYRSLILHYCRIFQSVWISVFKKSKLHISLSCSVIGGVWLCCECC